MADSEKLTALKKAYADVILNTAKEAAARIMVSERKAQRYQQELFAAKDEALRMLLRLKQMLDAKVNEADKVYMDQQKRIEELEAQLGEAEDIVRDLRAELREAQDELERGAKERMRSREESTPKDDKAGHVENLQEHTINNSEPLASCLPRERSDVMTASDVKIPVQNETYMGNHCSCKDNCYVCNPDFASIVMRRREPDGYRNGCTQRILALERCLFGEKLPSKKEEDDKKNSSVRDESKKASLKLDPNMGIIAKSETKPAEVKVTQGGKSFNQLHVVNSFPRKKKRAARLKKNKVPPLRNIINQNELMYQGSETYQESELLCHETIPYDVQNNGLSVKDSRLSEKDNHNDHQSPLSDSLVEADVTTQSSYESSEGTLEIRKARFHVDKENGNLPTGKDELIRHRSQSAGNSGFQSSDMDPQTVEVVMADSDIKTTESTEELFSQPKYNSSIKYTFQRKRKKEPLISPEKYIAADNDTPQKMAQEKQDVLLDSQETSLIAESSRDGRRLAQVARQLISLSEKKRW